MTSSRADYPCLERYINKIFQRVSFDIGAKMANFLATGNLVSPSGLDLQQAAGFTIVAEKLNWYRYISHFRCVHRGAFFAELKTTDVRKLLPESWGMAFYMSRCRAHNGHRFHLSRSYARWFTLRPSQPLNTVVSDRHKSSEVFPSTHSTVVARHDSGICHNGRWQ